MPCLSTVAASYLKDSGQTAHWTTVRWKACRHSDPKIGLQRHCSTFDRSFSLWLLLEAKLCLILGILFESRINLIGDLLWLAYLLSLYALESCDDFWASLVILTYGILILMVGCLCLTCEPTMASWSCGWRARQSYECNCFAHFGTLIELASSGQRETDARGIS